MVDLRDKQTVEAIDINLSWCKGCLICKELCPKNVYDAAKKGKPVPARIEDCIYCRLCELRCPDMAIRIDVSDPQWTERHAAECLCQGGLAETKDKIVYEGKVDCRKRHIVDGGSKECAYGCLGGGNCADICPTGAIRMNENRLPQVDPAICVACGLCADACPRNLYTIYDDTSEFHVRCVNTDKGAVAGKTCTVACIKCKKCERACPYDAVHIVDGVAKIDHVKCMNCGICRDICPKKSIYHSKLKEIRFPCRVEVAKCSGCAVCTFLCPVGCLTMEHGRAVIEEDACIGCEICFKQCPEQAIFLVNEEINSDKGVGGK